MQKRGLWCGASDAGTTPEQVEQFVERIADAGFNLILPNLKQGHGRLCWPSNIHPELVLEQYKEFDLPKHLLECCRRHNIEVHAWFIDFMEGPDHLPEEWAQRDKNGEPTDHEQLRGSTFPFRWMCPAQRPGYTDRHLVPLYEEFAQLYDFDAVHHDYVRYPGDLAPDQYCFCDHCIEAVPKYAGYTTESFPERAFTHPTYDREYLESHWEPSPRVLPGNWSELSRARKAEFLLEEGFFEGGRKDLDYFFYEYRVHWVTEFNRLCAERIRMARPGMKVSSAIFKNPVQSGRFIGQDWRQHAPYVDVAIPMDYRDHFPGSFDDYLVLLTETIQEQKVWAREFKEYIPGAAINFLFWEEEVPLKALALAAELGDRANASAFFGQVSNRLNQEDPDLHERIAKWVGFGGAGDLRDAQRYVSHKRAEFFAIPAGGAPPNFAAELRVFADNPPKSYWPKRKLERLVETVQSADTQGLVLFCEGHLHQYGLWDAVRALFNPGSH